MSGSRRGRSRSIPSAMLSAIAATNLSLERSSDSLLLASRDVRYDRQRSAELPSLSDSAVVEMRAQHGRRSLH